ncbi:MAG: hypothetical protein IKR69_01990 [Bacteroidales bacterium]|nr:hypothetical protein [Bacteroidales bacterium]
MAEPRKIVLILGNGFDLDLGLKTSYKDFWESEFCPRDYPAPLIHHLNQKWPDNLDAVKWYDLENELLNYAIQGDKSDVVSVHERDYIQSNSDYELHNRINFIGGDDIMSSLVEKGYMKISKNLVYKVSIPYKEDYSQTSNWRDRKALKLIKEGLCKYLTFIDKPIPESHSVAFHLLLAMTKCVKAGDTVDIYSFNYTRVQLQGHSMDRIPVYYMHGSCEKDKIIVGTRDGTPIIPEYDFLQKVMDDSFLPPDIVRALDNADEVIIFGHSLGENDRQYFEKFFTNQTNGSNQKEPYIIIFTRDSNSMKDIKRSLKSLTGDRLSLLYSSNLPIFIRTGELKEDQKLFFDFLVDHHTDMHFASEVIGKLLK